MKDLMDYQALPVHLDQLVPKALPDQVAKEEKREPRVPWTPGKTKQQRITRTPRTSRPVW